MNGAITLSDLGWDGWFESHFHMLDTDGLRAARVCAQHRGAFVVQGETGEQWAELTGKFRYSITRRSEMPTVGDWVAVREAESAAPITRILPRKTWISRTEAGGRADLPADGPVRTEEQVLAANLDFVFVVSGLGGEFNVRRVERYVTMIWEGGAIPVIVLNKIDLGDPGEAIARLKVAAPTVDIHPISALTGTGLETLENYMGRGKTVALVGSSGVGKTSLVNKFVDDERAVRPIRSDGRGRHTTTRRELIFLSNGGMLIDTPGLRELQLWNSADGLERTFEDVTEIAAMCRFSDCSHESEPGCAVRAALEEGIIEMDRVMSYQKLKRELDFLERRQNPRLERENRQKWKAITKAMRNKSRP